MMIVIVRRKRTVRKAPPPKWQLTGNLRMPDTVFVCRLSCANCRYIEDLAGYRQSLVDLFSSLAHNRKIDSQSGDCER